MTRATQCWLLAVERKTSPASSNPSPQVLLVDVVAVGVLQQQDVGGRGDDQPAAGEHQPRGTRQALPRASKASAIGLTTSGSAANSSTRNPSGRCIRRSDSCGESGAGGPPSG